MDDPGHTARSVGFLTRLRAHIRWGIGAGLLLGFGIGILVGSLISSPGHRAFWITAASVTLFATIIGALVGGYGSLESPDPGREPSDTQRPTLDRSQATRIEHDRRGIDDG